IGVSGGAYSVNGGGYTGAAGTVNNGDTLSVRLTSASSTSTQTCATLSIGGVNGAFCATTRALSAPTATAATGISSGGGHPHREQQRRVPRELDQPGRGDRISAGRVDQQHVHELRQRLSGPGRGQYGEPNRERLECGHAVLLPRTRLRHRRSER